MIEQQILDKKDEPENKLDSEIIEGVLGDREKEIARIRREKQKQWERLQIRQSTSTFRPLAADYDAEITKRCIFIKP